MILSANQNLATDFDATMASAFDRRVAATCSASVQTPRTKIIAHVPIS